ncbi:MAG: glutamine-hydrolyzing GMP synthase [Arsenophonus sp.]|nr:MAG: glutamine-hydrolyzing GMP synthase [Arsenophonus sp.]
MISNIYKYKILILDFGSQYAKLIVRRVRDIGVYCELYPWHASENQIREFNPNGIILSGGPNSSIKYDSPRASEYVFKSGVPVLGICYGMHIMSVQLGGKVGESSDREFGYAQVFIEKSCKLLHNIYDRLSKTGTPLLDVWMSHGDTVTVIPHNFKIIGTTNNCQCAIIANDIKKFYGIQFHPEVTHTYQGNAIFQRFILDICKCKRCWIPMMIIDDKIQQLKKKIGSDKVILALSGGVDSSVAAVLLNRAIGKQLICIFVDNGLLRLNEEKQIIKMFKKFNLNIIKISAEARFLNALSGIHESELKRKIIGRVFIEVFEEEASKQNAVRWLAQGTIYPDLIESAFSKSYKSHLIKSHHNVGGLPKNMQLKLLEPLKYLFKDEVRKLGLELGLPYDILYRHPFPGPGLGVRIIGEVKKVYCDLLRQADAIFIEELYKENLYYKISQAFAVFLPVRSVGVMGDTRTYNWVVSLRAVETIDFMTADWARLPYSFLSRVSNRIINEIVGISRVVYDISSKPPATIEWE